MYGFGGVGLSEVQISISELSVVGGGWVGGGGWTRQTHFMVGPGRGPTKTKIMTICSWKLDQSHATSSEEQNVWRLGPALLCPRQISHGTDTATYLLIPSLKDTLVSMAFGYDFQYFL